MIFSSPRLIARRFETRDLADFMAMRNDPDVARYQSWENYSEAEGQRLIEELAGEEPGSAGWFQIALEDKAAGVFAGDLGLNMSEDGRQARIGYSIVKAFWNRGLATEAVQALVAYCFDAFPVHRISASVDPRNQASCRVLEKSGFVKEGHFRQSEWFKGAWADDAIYARLRD